MLSLSCSNCLSPNVVGLCGNKCGKAMYCSTQCAKEHYSVHLMDCHMHLTDVYQKVASNTKAKELIFETEQMSMYAIYVQPYEEIPSEIHPDATQLFHVINGSGKAIIGKNSDDIQKDSMFYVPAGTEHRIVASGSGLNMYTVYAPAKHKTK